MPPRKFSRHTFTLGFNDTDQEGVAEKQLMLSDREPFVFRVLSDNRQHVVAEGDTLFSLAAKYFAPLPRAAGLWWAIADYQPDPIHDPTIKLVVGQVLVVPSVRTITELVFSEQRRLGEVPVIL